MLLRVNLCDECTKKLRAFRQQLGDRAMAAQAGQILQACPQCRQQLPQTEGKLFTKLKEHDARPGFDVPKG